MADLERKMSNFIVSFLISYTLSLINLQDESLAHLKFTCITPIFYVLGNNKYMF